MAESMMNEHLQTAMQSVSHHPSDVDDDGSGSLILKVTTGTATAASQTLFNPFLN